MVRQPSDGKVQKSLHSELTANEISPDKESFLDSGGWGWGSGGARVCVHGCVFPLRKNKVVAQNQKGTQKYEFSKRKTIYEHV